MASGKISPRQKMIGMMYLVLTALLALNISKEIILAFVIINHGIETTTENFSKKNQLTYSDFEFQEKNNPAKVKSFHDKAKVVKKLSDDTYNYIQGLKHELMARADNLSKQAQDTITLEHVEAKDENNVPIEIMIGSTSDGSKGKARELKNKLNDLKKKLIAVVAQIDKAYAAKINIPIETNDPPVDKEGIKYTWETHNFEVPLAPCITILSKIQSDVRNAEADLINYLYSQVSARDFKFDTLAAKVIPKSSYVVIGQEYEADVFVGAFSTTQNPKILIGSVDTTKNEMIGKGDSIPVERGIGKYRVKPSSEGPQKWGGLIIVKSPDGTEKPYRFNAEYISAKPSAVVSPDKMNVLYIGIPNPISISVNGFAADKVSASISSGSLSPSGKGKGSYLANVSTRGEATISVMAETEPGKKQAMGQFKFRVKSVPDPVAIIDGKKGGPISKSRLSAQAGIIANLENFEFEGVNFRVTEFEMTIAGKGRDIMNDKSKSNLLTENMKSMIGKVRLDDKVYFENIKAVGPGGDTRSLGTIGLVIK